MRFTLHIRRTTPSEVLILLILTVTMSVGFMQLVGLPHIVLYAIDVLWLLLLGTIVINKFRMPNAQTRKLLWLVLVFFIVTLTSSVLHLSNPLFYLWGFRNNFRFLVFFFACAMFLTEHTVDQIFRVLRKLFFLNFAVTLIQFFLLGESGDRLGGIFGTNVGCNSKTLIFLSIMSAASVLDYLNGKKSLRKCFVECSIAILIAALAELKSFFVIFLFLVTLAAFITKFSMKNLLIILFAGLGVCLGASLLVAVFPKWENIFNIDSMLLEVARQEGYTGRGEMNRLTALPMIWDQFLTSWPDKLFGLGLGNCETSAYRFLETPFHLRYGLLRYDWFSSAMLFLETGVLGTGIFISFFVLIFRFSRRRMRRGEGRSDWCQLGQLMAPLGILLIIYNASMRIEEGFLMYFALALPFIQVRSALSGQQETSCACIAPGQIMD